MVFQTILLTASAFFTAIDASLFLWNFAASILLGIAFRKQIIETLSETIADYRSLSVYSKCILPITLLTALLKCAQSPFILDNESYYVQTIKWLNEYGLVKGLANFNVGFAQTSPWHILQSGFNLSFLTDRLNDINGFLLVICAFYFLTVFEKKWQLEKKFHWIGFIVFFDVLSFQFINSPSPDIPLFLIVQIILLLFLEGMDSGKHQKTIILFFIFLAFIKITIAPLAILLIYVLYNFRKSLYFTIITGSIFGILWMAKNTILSGYPLFPFEYFDVNVDWKIPKNLLHFISGMIKDHEFIDVLNYESLTLFEKFMLWIKFDGINGIFNKGIIILFILAPFTKLLRSKLEYKIIYVALLLHFITVFIVSPQFRFFLAEFLFLTAIISSEIANRINVSHKFIFGGLIVASLLPLPILFFGNFESLTKNKFNQRTGEFRTSQFWLPEKNAKYADVNYEFHQKGNLKYYSPNPNFFFYGTANGPLPCTNVRFMDYVEQVYFLVPQLRTKDLKDGFYSADISKKVLP